MKFRVILVFTLIICSLVFAYKTESYTVKSGDSLYSIANEFKVNISTVIDFNDIGDPRNIRVGSELLIPKPDGLVYEVKPGESMGYIAKLFFAPLNLLLKENRLKESSVIHVGQKIFIPSYLINMYEYVPTDADYRWPVYGVISSEYGWRTHPISGKRSFHTGLDIAAPEDAPIFNGADGYVVFAAENGGYGYMVEVQHDDGTTTIYAHMSHISVYKGQRVYTGSLLGRVGETGVATGPHVHFEVHDKNDKTTNPLSTLPSRNLMYVEKDFGNQSAAGGK